MGHFVLSTEFRTDPDPLKRLLWSPGLFETVTDPAMEFELIAAPPTVSAGEEISFSVLAGGFRQILRHRWTTVTDDRIVAEQVSGPMQSWVHIQSLAPVDSGCRLTDEIRFDPPSGVLGMMVTEEAIRDSLQQTMSTRHRLIAEYLAAQQPA